MGFMIVLAIVIIILVSMQIAYTIIFYMDGYYREAETKKEYMLQWFVPCYWWIKGIIGFIQERVKFYKEM